MARKREGIQIKNKNKSKPTGKINFETLYDQISEDNPILKANKPFWMKRGNSQKYFCDLCNIGIQVSTNMHSFKSALLAHVEDKYHKKRFDLISTKENTSVCHVGISADKEKSKGQFVYTVEDELRVLDIVQPEEEAHIGGTEDKNWRDTSIRPVDFNTVYDSFEKSNPVVKSSKQFIEKWENGRDFYCTLCKVLVFNSLSGTEFKYNLFVHLNEKSHTEKLPNFSEIKEDFERVMLNLSKVLPASYKDEIKCFEIGPVFRFVKCSSCEVAVSTNLHRLENHLKSENHLEKRQSAIKGKSLESESLNQRTRNAFRKLVVQLDPQFKKEVKYIHIGKIPGYSLCSLCSYVVLPTKFFMETHLSSAVHEKNKTSSIVNRNSKFKINLKDLLKTLPEDLRDYDIFNETACGLTCKRCDTTIPPTSYDLYTHINKERLACVST